MISPRVSLLLSLSILLLALAACGEGGRDEAPVPIAAPTGSEPLELVDPEASPRPTETLLPLPTLDFPTAAPRAQVTAVPIEFGAEGTPASLPGTVAPGGTNRYLVNGQAGQTMRATLTLTQGFALLVVLGADGSVLISDRPDPTAWSGKLPAAQQYAIDVKGAAGQGEVSYTLTVELAGPAE